MAIAEQITGPDAEHGEGPVWYPAWGGLRWVDMTAGDILHMDINTGAVDRWHVGNQTAALRPRDAGGAVIATELRFVLADVIGGPLREVAHLVDHPNLDFNEGTCDPQGRFWCGTAAEQSMPGQGAMYRLNSNYSVEQIFDDVTISNGLAWTAGGSLAYYVDTPTSRIDVFDYTPDAGLQNRRTFVEIDPAAGFPDGLTIDAEGGVWVALWGGHAVRRYDPTGRLSDTVGLPVPNVTACTFGGPDLNELYITTSSLETPRNISSRAGAIFRHKPGVSGQPVTPYAG